MVRLARAEARVRAAVDGWRIQAGLPEVRRRAARVRGAVAELEPMLVDGPSADGWGARAEREAVVAIRMRQTPVVGATIPGLGARHRHAIAGLGAMRAADLTPERLASIPGIGAGVVAALLVWRDRVEAEADREIARQPPAGPAVLARYASSRRAEAESRLAIMAESLGEAITRAGAAMGRPRCEVDAALRARAQAVADLQYLGFPLCAAVPSVRTGRASPTCPACGGPLVRRWAPGGPSAPSVGSRFLGCASYPACSGSRTLRGPQRP